MHVFFSSLLVFCRVRVSVCGPVQTCFMFEKKNRFRDSGKPYAYVVCFFYDAKKKEKKTRIKQKAGRKRIYNYTALEVCNTKSKAYFAVAVPRVSSGSFFLYFVVICSEEKKY